MPDTYEIDVTISQVVAEVDVTLQPIVAEIEVKLGTDGLNGRGITNESYNPSTGILTLTFSDNSTYSTGDLRGLQGLPGAPGVDGVDGDDGANGRGITNESYNPSTGILTLTFSDNSTYSTGDLRGPGLLNLTGLVTTNRSKIIASDTPLVAFGKAQAQINATPMIILADNTLATYIGIAPSGTVIKTWTIPTSLIPLNGLMRITLTFTYLQTQGSPTFRLHGFGSNSATAPTGIAGTNFVFSQNIGTATTVRGIWRELRHVDYRNGEASIIAGSYNVASAVHDFGGYTGVENGRLSTTGVSFIHLLAAISGGTNALQDITINGLYIDFLPITT